MTRYALYTMSRFRRDCCRWRCHWSLVTCTALALILYNAAMNVYLLRPPSCPAMTTSPPSTPATCEPCTDNPNSIIEDDPIAKLDLRLGRWDASRTFRLYDYATVGDMYAEVSANHRVCLATQSSIERLHELLRIAAHWTGPISVAVFVAGDELRLLRGFATWLFRCHPEIYTRIVIHVAMPAERPGLHGGLPVWARDCDSSPLPPGGRRADTVAWRAKHPYPQNHLRNIARKNCHTPYVFLVDIDIVPSKGMSDALDKFLETAPKCPMCAYVVPTYELDNRVANFPANKSELLRLSRRKLAIPFHRKVFIYNQYASNFSRWESTGGNESSNTHISHNVTNFELLYEPFYLAPDTVPPHDERFLGYGFTRNTQVSMILNRNSFCGGFIISSLYILTAAHCAQNVPAAAIRLRVGSTRRDSGGRIVQVANVTVHPQYGMPQYDNDIAALRLAAPLVFSDAVRAVRLPLRGETVPLARMTVTGWGLTAPRGRRIPRIMMEARVPVIPHWLCRLSYGDALTNNMFCGGHFLIGGVSSCQGDSGGPAVFRGTAFGVVSFARGCALPLSPTVFTNLASTSMRDWVTQNTGV